MELVDWHPAAYRPTREWATAHLESGQAKHGNPLENFDSLPKNFQAETRRQQDQRTACRARPPASEDELRQRHP